MDLKEIQRLIREGKYEFSFHAQQGKWAMNDYADCTYCGGEVAEKMIDYDYRREKHLMVVNNVPAGVCRQCGEKYFKPEVLKQMDSIYHDIFDRHQKPKRTLTVPAVSL